MKDRYTNNENNQKVSKELSRVVKEVAQASAIMPYYVRERKTYLIAKNTAFSNNIISMLLASFGAYTFLFIFTKNQFVSIVISIILLVGLEFLKRFCTDKIYKKWIIKDHLHIGFLILNVSFFGLSVITSNYGSDQIIETQAPPPELLYTNQRVDSLKVEIAKEEKALKKLMAQKDTKSGVTFYELQPAVKSKNLFITQLKLKKEEQESKLDGNRELLTAEHSNTMDFYRLVGFFVMIINELCFEICFIVMWKYKRRVAQDIALDLGIEFHEFCNQIMNGEYSVEDFVKHNLESQKDTTLPSNKKQSSFNQIAEPAEQRPNPSGSFAQAVLGDQWQNQPVKRPIGFFIDNKALSNKDEAAGKPDSKKLVQACTSLYTIEHILTGGSGRGKSVWYTEAVVSSRVSQYKKTVDSLTERLNKASDAIIIEKIQSSLLHNKKVLKYWEKRHTEFDEQGRVIKALLQTA